MSRIARVIVCDVPYHVTHRGNRRDPVFFSDADRLLYLSQLKRHASEQELDIWAWCLMPNHVHLLAVPRNPESLARGVGLTHQYYSRVVNKKQGWTGHLWANRFHSTALDGDHLWEAVRYIEANPVRAGLVSRAEDWQWSSCREHAGLTKPTGLLAPKSPFPGRIGRSKWARWVSGPPSLSVLDDLRANTAAGRPSGGADFVSRLEDIYGRPLTRPVMGRPRKAPKPDEKQKSPTRDMFKKKS